MHTSAVGLPTRFAAASVDALLPSVSLACILYFDAIKLPFLEPQEGIFVADHVFHLLYRAPRVMARLPVIWMALWTVFNLAFLSTVKTTPGKRLFRLKVRQRNGRQASGGRMILRVAAAWTVPLSLGLGFLWIVVSPERRAWHDTLSTTFVARDMPTAGRNE